MISFTIDNKEVDLLLSDLMRINKSNLHRGIGFIIENSVVAEVDRMGLVDTGAFKNSINHNVYDETHVKVGDQVKYGKYLEFGTRSRNTLLSKEHRSKLSGGIQEYAPFRKGLIKSIKAIEDFVAKKILKEAT